VFSLSYIDSSLAEQFSSEKMKIPSISEDSIWYGVLAVLAFMTYFSVRNIVFPYVTKRLFFQTSFLDLVKTNILKIHLEVYWIQNKEEKILQTFELLCKVS